MDRSAKDMTWKEARRRMQSELQETTEEQNPAMIQLLQRVRNKPFYQWFDKNHKQIIDSDKYVQRNCCFNCILGWPEKKSGNTLKRYPLFDYENNILKAIEVPNYINFRKSTEEDEVWFEEQKRLLEKKAGINKEESITTALDKLLKEKHSRLIHKHKVSHLALLKSSGLGISTLMTRWIAYKCMVNDSWKNTDVVILTGPRQSLSNDIISMIKKLFLPFGITFDTSVSTLILNGVRIRAFPSEGSHLSAARGIPQVSCIYCDEASYFSPQSQKEVIDLIERYAGKSNATIVLTSTPNRVGDLMHTILSQPFEQSFYKVMRLSWEWGRDKIYNNQDLETARKSSSWMMECPRPMRLWPH